MDDPEIIREPRIVDRDKLHMLFTMLNDPEGAIRRICDFPRANPFDAPSCVKADSQERGD